MNNIRDAYTLHQSWKLKYNKSCHQDTQQKAASHYRQRSRVCRFLPNRFQEIKNSASQVLTLHTKDQSPKAIAFQNAYMVLFFAMDSQRKII